MAPTAMALVRVDGGFRPHNRRIELGPAGSWFRMYVCCDYCVSSLAVAHKAQRGYVDLRAIILLTGCENKRV